MSENKIIILDFGGQYAHLIADRVRRLNVFSEIKLPTVDVKELKDAKGIILSGGPSSVYDKDAPKFNKEIFSLDVPMLGLCYGHQLMARELGVKVDPGKTKEYGFAELEVKDKKGIFKGMDDEEAIWMSHGDAVEKVPKGFNIIGSTKDCPVAAMGNFSKDYYGFQFHPEVTHTKKGMNMLENFVFGICKCKPTWTIDNYIDVKIKEIKDTVKDRKVFLLVSGGVDSTVAFSLLEKALGHERVYGLHIDNGLVRKNESQKVKKALEEHGFRNLHVVDASEEFISALKDIYDPEKKRQIIGKVFIKVQERILAKLNLNPKDWILGQGTIYPDTIETAGTENAALIKTHHNRVKIVQEMIKKGLVIEPLADLYKDEVRELGEKLGLPHRMVYRHPFPGPGLGVRCLCLKKENPVNDKEVHKKVQEIAGDYNSYILPIKSVGVQGDARTYRNPVVLAGKYDFEKLQGLATAIPNKVKEINRVLYLVKPKEMMKIDTKKEYITKERLDVLVEADDIVLNILKEEGIYDGIWQMPVVLIPVGSGGESIVLRPVDSREAMTASAAEISEEILEKMAQKIIELPGVDYVFYDLTNKPPGTIEWE